MFESGVANTVANTVAIGDIDVDVDVVQGWRIDTFQ